MEFETRTYHITGKSTLLGSQAASEDIRTKYLMSKAKDVDTSDELGLEPNDEDDKMTVFLRDAENDDRLFLMNYTIKGFFKAALSALKQQLGVAAPAKKVDTLVSVSPRRIPVTREGEDLLEEDGVYERPLRAQTMKGERVALASSERIDTPWEIDIRVALLPNEGTKVSKALTFDALEMCLDYGANFVGMGQFRTGGFGQFSWERVGK